MTDWLVYRGRGSAGTLARRGLRPAPSPGVVALTGPVDEPGNSAPAGIVAG